jgi:hypothetical protein
VDRGDIFEAHRKLHHKFPISGGIPNVLLSYGTPQEVRDHCKKVIDGVAKDGGYIMDASAIMQDDTSVENMKVMTDFCREYGVYSASSSPAAPAKDPLRPCDGSDVSALVGLQGRPQPRIKPGVCFPWEDKVKELPEITGDKALVRRIWEMCDSLGNTYIWQCLLSF